MFWEVSVLRINAYGHQLAFQRACLDLVIEGYQFDHRLVRLGRPI